jgi:Uma2 family endonuclease
MSFAEYLATEEAAPMKREWVHGEVFAISGGTIVHSALATVVLGALIAALRGRPCRALNPDARIRVAETGLATYPDISVVCGPIVRDAEDHEGINNPTVLVEVLSETTESWDRGGKWAHYQRIPSLRHYLLFSQDQTRVELFTRQSDGTWIYRDHGAGGRVDLPAIETSLDLDAIYAEARAVAG